MDARAKGSTAAQNDSGAWTPTPPIGASKPFVSSTAKRALDSLALPKRLAALGIPAFTAALGVYAQTTTNFAKDQDVRSSGSASKGALKYSQSPSNGERAAPLASQIEETRKAIQEERKEIELLRRVVDLLKEESSRRKQESERVSSEPLSHQGESPKGTQGAPSTLPTSTAETPPPSRPPIATTPQASAVPQQPPPPHHSQGTPTSPPPPQLAQAPAATSPMQPAASVTAQLTPQKTPRAPSLPIYTPIAPAPPNAYYKYPVLDDTTIRKHLARGATMPSPLPTYTPQQQQQPNQSQGTSVQAFLVSLSQIQSLPGHAQNVVTISSLPNFLNGQMVVNRILDRCQRGVLTGIAYMYNLDQLPSPSVQVHLHYGVAPEPVRDAIIKHVLQEPWYPGGK